MPVAQREYQVQRRAVVDMRVARRADQQVACGVEVIGIRRGRMAATTVGSS
jgi:hypothetical protein